jgi:hypothetical protein
MVAYRGERGAGSTAPSPADMLEVATRNAARGLGREDDLGSIEVGKNADLILVDLERPHLAPSSDPITSLVHYGQGSDVASVMIDGESVMRDRVVLTLDERTVLGDVEQARASAWTRFSEHYPSVDLRRPYSAPPECTIEPGGASRFQKKGGVTPSASRQLGRSRV